MYIERDTYGRTWSAVSDMAIEEECGDLLYGLIRIVKPRIVVETGTGAGIATEYIATALADNAVDHWEGILHTADTNRARLTATQEAFDPELQEHVIWHHATGVAMIQSIGEVDFAFLDSSSDRFEEAEALKLSADGIVVLHDSRRPVAEKLKKNGWTEVFVPTPRGVSVFQWR